MKIILIITAILLFSMSGFAQKTEQKYVYIETSIGFTHEKNLKDWKATVPYKNCVRIVSETFDVPAKADYGSMYRDITIQFYEYLMNNHLEDLKKMRLQTDGGLQLVEYNATVPMLVKNYKETSQGINNLAWEPICQLEIILIKGFKYTPNKYTNYEKYQGTTPLYKEALEIIYGTKK